MLTTILSKLENTTTKQFYFAAAVMAAIIAAQMQYIQHGWINPDSVLYFESARLIALGDFKAAVAVFNWPLYSICIAIVHKITTLDIHQSAQVLNVVFFTITTLSFIKLISLAGGNKVTMASGALILFSSSYVVGDVLEMLMRDEGFWAFYLTSLVCFIRFYQHQRYRDAFLWQLSAIIAMLFRIEAIMYLVFLPFVLLFHTDFSWQQRFKLVIKAHFLNIIAALSILATLALSQHMTIANFGRLKEVFSTNLWHELTQNLVARAQVMSTEVLGQYLDEFAIQGLLLTFIFVIIVKIISAAGLINVVLATLTVNRRHIPINQSAQYVLTAAAIISLINMSLIITKVFVLSTRYVVGLGFIVMIFASFYLAYLINQSQTSTIKPTKKWLIYAILIFMVLSGIKNVLPKRDGYNYMQEAVAWAHHNKIDSSNTFYNDSRLRHYANAKFIGTWNNNDLRLLTAINNNELSDYQFLMLAYSDTKEASELINNGSIQFKQIKRFNNNNKRKIVTVYQRIN